MSKLSVAIRKVANRLGYDITKGQAPDPSDLIGIDPVRDMKRSFGPDARPVIFDVGANVGQTIERFKGAFPASDIHSFEPSPRTFAKLGKRARDFKDVRLWNFAFGSAEAEMPFFENNNPDMSSFLPLGTAGWGTIEKETMVPVKTIDAFCGKEGIERIDILKSDTQGYDLEVFKGAERMMREQRIGQIYFEVIFSDIYKNLPKVHEIFAFLSDHGFLLVGLYGFTFQNNLANWADALFVHKSLRT